MMNNHFTYHRIEGRPELFVRQLDGPQYLFQVLEFESEAQLVAAVSKMQDRVVRIVPHLVCLRFAGNLVHVDVGQDNWREVLDDIDRVRKEAAVWVREQWTTKTLKTSSNSTDPPPAPPSMEGSR